jgi:hypothetical protein
MDAFGKWSSYEEYTNSPECGAEPIVEVNASFVRERFNYIPEVGLFTRNYGASFGIPLGKDFVFRGTKYSTLRLIWLWWYGEWPDGRVFHKNGILTDRRISNLVLKKHKRLNKNPKARKH